jgi:hypothetical protein
MNASGMKSQRLGGAGSAWYRACGNDRWRGEAGTTCSTVLRAACTISYPHEFWHRGLPHTGSSGTLGLLRTHLYQSIRHAACPARAALSFQDTKNRQYLFEAPPTMGTAHAPESVTSRGRASSRMRTRGRSGSRWRARAGAPPPCDHWKRGGCLHQQDVFWWNVDQTPNTPSPIQAQCERREQVQF